MKRRIDLWVLAGAAVGGIIAVRAWGNKLNPFSQDNVANQAADSTYKALTGSEGTIGGDLYNLLHPEDAILAGGPAMTPDEQASYQQTGSVPLAYYLRTGIKPPLFSRAWLASLG